MASRRTRLQVIAACMADGVSLKPGTYNGEEYLHPSINHADGNAAKTYSLWPYKHIVPVKVTHLVEQGVIRFLD